MRSDQEKAMDTENAGQTNGLKATALRQELRALCRLIAKLERQHEHENGAQLPASYTQAIIVLLDYHEQKKAPTLSDLVELLDIDKSNVTRLCQRMEQSGYIELKRDDKDRRAKRIYLTQEGIDFAEQINEESTQAFSEIVDNFPTDDQRQLLALLARLNQIVRQQTNIPQ